MDKRNRKQVGLRPLGMMKAEVNQGELTERQERFLFVIYMLSGANTQVTVAVQDVIDECKRLRIFDLSQEEFDKLKREVIARKNN